MIGTGKGVQAGNGKRRIAFVGIVLSHVEVGQVGELREFRLGFSGKSGQCGSESTRPLPNQI